MRQPGHLLVAFSGSDSRYGLKVLSKVLLLYCGLLHITAVFVQCFLQAFHVEQICTTGTYLVREFRCYEVKIEESEKAGSRQESNPGHLCQCSATEPHKPGVLAFSLSFIFTS